MSMNVVSEYYIRIDFAAFRSRKSGPLDVPEFCFLAQRDSSRRVGLLHAVQLRFLAKRKNGNATTTPISRDIKITW